MLTFTAKLTGNAGGEAYTDQAAMGAHRAHLKDRYIDLRAVLDGAPKLECYEKLV